MFSDFCGFTIIESLVVVAVILILASLILPGYRAGQARIQLENSAARLAQDLRRAEEMSLASREFRGLIPLGGYGISLQKAGRAYVLFADCNNNHQYTTGTVCGGASEEVETMKLEGNVVVAALLPGPVQQDIAFRAPDPAVYFSPDSTWVTITLAVETSPSQTRQILVNKSGLIQVR